MAGRKRSSSGRPFGPSGALVIWLAVLVIGVGVATVLVYRSAMASHTGKISAAEAAARLEARRLQVSVGASDDMRAAQAALLRSGTTDAGAAAPNPVPPPAEVNSETQASPAR